MVLWFVFLFGRGLIVIAPTLLRGQPVKSHMFSCLFESYCLFAMATENFRLALSMPL